jgi:ABC-type molybdenum transport system ATPase subunit/photorepair protein PhrA
MQGFFRWLENAHSPCASSVRQSTSLVTRYALLFVRSLELHFSFRSDEPTNHLDLDACVWLEEELRNYKRILIMVSHSQDFLNGVCTNIVHLTKKKLFVYGVSDCLWKVTAWRRELLSG